MLPMTMPFLLAASTSTLLYPTTMLIKAVPPARLSSDKSTYPKFIFVLQFYQYNGIYSNEIQGLNVVTYNLELRSDLF
jgi:hypothetical protein